MLQRFPVESKGRRKKLQEVFTFLEIIIVTFHFFLFKISEFIFVGLLSWAGWLCDHHMFYMFPCPMHYGEFTWILFTFTSRNPCLCFLNQQNQNVDLVWCLLSLILMKLLGWSIDIYLISEVYTWMLYVWFWCIYFLWPKLFTILCLLLGHS